MSLRGTLLQRLRGLSTPFEVLGQVLADMQPHFPSPVLILDGLDKVGPERASELFIGRPLLSGLPGSAVLTLPLSVVYSPEFQRVSNVYHNANRCVVPAVRLYSWTDHGRALNKKGFSILSEILKSRIRSAGDKIDSVVTKKAREQVVLAAGGNLREMIKLLQESIIKTMVSGRREAKQVKPADVDAAVQDRRETYRRGLRNEFIPVLKQVQATGKMTGAAPEVSRLLLDGIWVVEYRNHENWYDLPLPVQMLLAPPGGGTEAT